MKMKEKIMGWEGNEGKFRRLSKYGCSISNDEKEDKQASETLIGFEVWSCKI